MGCKGSKTGSEKLLGLWYDFGLAKKRQVRGQSSGALRWFSKRAGSKGKGSVKFVALSPTEPPQLDRPEKLLHNLASLLEAHTASHTLPGGLAEQAVVQNLVPEGLFAQNASHAL